MGFGSVFGPRSTLVSGGFGGPFLRIRSGGSFRIVWSVCPRGPFLANFSGWLAPLFRWICGVVLWKSGGVGFGLVFGRSSNLVFAVLGIRLRPRSGG